MPENDVPPTTADAFEVLANEHRLDVLLALLSARERPDLPYPIGFAALHDETDVEYSSQLSYHLEELLDDFVEKDESGYALSVAGWAIASFVRSDVLDDHTVRDDIRATGECHRCGEAGLVGTYADYRFRLTCVACGEVHLRTAIRPPAVRGRTDRAILDVVDGYVRARTRLLAGGTCPQCYGEVEGALVDEPIPDLGDDALAPDASAVPDVRPGAHARVGKAAADPGGPGHEAPDGDPGHVRYCCRNCGHCVSMPPGRRAAVDAEVRAFFAERGAPLDAGHLWEYAFCVDQRHGAFRGRDRDAYHLELAHAGHSLYAEVDAEGGVTLSTTDPAALRLG